MHHLLRAATVVLLAGIIPMQAQALPAQPVANAAGISRSCGIAACRSLRPLQAATAHTPRDATARAYIAADAGDQAQLTGPLFSTLQGEGYTTGVKIGATRKLGSKGGCAIPKSGAGVLLFESGPPLPGIMPFCISVDDATGRREAQSLYAGLRSGGKVTAAEAGKGPVCSGGWCGVGLTPAGIAHEPGLFKNTLVLLAMIGKQSAAFAQAMLKAGAYDVVYVTGKPLPEGHLINLINVMGGMSSSASSLQDNAQRALPEALSACGGDCSGLNLAGNQPLVLAPSILEVEPYMKSPQYPGPPEEGEPFAVSVHFDAMMNTSMPADSVVTLDGCGIQPADSSGTVAWQGDDTIEGTYMVTDSLTDCEVTITVHASQAVAQEAGTKLDGNDGGMQKTDNAISPAGDDFVYQIYSVIPVITRATYSASGTIEYVTTTNTGGRCNPDGSDNPPPPEGPWVQDTLFSLNWTTTWTTDSFSPLKLTPGSTTFTYPSRDPTLAGSGTKSYSQHDDCPAGTSPLVGGPDSCSIMVSRPGPETPTITVLTAGGSGRNRQWSIMVQFVIGGSGTYDESCNGASLGATGTVTDTVVTLKASGPTVKNNQSVTLPVSVNRSRTVGNTVISENWSGSVAITGNF